MTDRTAIHEPAEALAERWAIVVRSEPGQDVPVDVRVRRWLKSGLRGYGIRCESASSTTLPEQVKRLAAEVLELQAELDRLTRRLKRTA